MKTLLNEDQKTRIAKAVTEAEKNTSGEIIPMIVPRSDDYPGLRWLFATAFALAIAFVLAYLQIFHDPILYLWAQLPALALGFVIGGAPFIQRLLLPNALAAEEVHQRAVQAFLKIGIGATRDRTGILILVSLLEHRVEILADSGIHAKAPQGTWDKLVKKLLARIHEGHLTEGLEEAVTECGRILSKEFPRTSADTNELQDRVWLDS